VYQLILDELEATCPGPDACHGFQSWCPRCDDVSRVCDDQGCKTHKRDVDVLREMEGLDRDMALRALLVAGIEAEIASREKEHPPRGSVNNDGKRRWYCRHAISLYDYMDGEMADLERELGEIRRSRKLVPRE